MARFLEKAQVAGLLRRLDVAMAVAGGTTEVDRLALIESLRAAGASEVRLVNQALAAARGGGLAIEEPRGRMVVYIGAGVTDIAILSLASVVCARAVRVAGSALDDAIAAHARSNHRLAIGERTAELVKLRIGSATAGLQEPDMRVKGRCLACGLPREAVLRAAEVRSALAQPLRRIARAIREALDEAPPELSADLIETGVLLTGDRRCCADWTNTSRRTAGCL